MSLANHISYHYSLHSIDVILLIMSTHYVLVMHELWNILHRYSFGINSNIKFWFKCLFSITCMHNHMLLTLIMLWLLRWTKKIIYLHTSNINNIIHYAVVTSTCIYWYNEVSNIKIKHEAFLILKTKSYFW